MITARLVEATYTPPATRLHLEVVIPEHPNPSPETIAQAVIAAVAARPAAPIPIHYCHPDIVRHLPPITPS